MIGIALSENEVNALKFVHEETIRIEELKEKEEELRKLFNEINKLGGKIEVMTPNAMYWREVDKISSDVNYGYTYLKVSPVLKNFQITP